MGQTCVMVIVLLMAVVSLGLTLTALLTDHWYVTSTSPSVDPQLRQRYSFHFGLWRLCYDQGLPPDVAANPRYKQDGSCVYIYKQLIEKNEDHLDHDSRLRLHLSRTVLGCSIAGGAATLAALLSILCGMCRACSNRIVRRPFVYLSASLLLLLAAMCGIASGISFIALRDIDNTTVRAPAAVVTSSSPAAPTPVLPLPPSPPGYAGQGYAWSFMLHWVATGLALVDSFLLLALLYNNYDTVGGHYPAKADRYRHM